MRVFKKLLARIPTKLPVGLIEFDEYCDDIFDLYSLPSLPSYKQAIASMMMHLPPAVFYKPKHYFGMCSKKAQANEVAWQVLETLRAQEKEKALKESEQKKLEQKPFGQGKIQTHVDVSNTEVQTAPKEVVL